MKYAKVIESEIVNENKEFKYYVSFIEYNRRMDMWVD